MTDAEIHTKPRNSLCAKLRKMDSATLCRWALDHGLYDELEKSNTHEHLLKMCEKYTVDSLGEDSGYDCL